MKVIKFDSDRNDSTDKIYQVIFENGTAGLRVGNRIRKSIQITEEEWLISCLR